MNITSSQTRIGSTPVGLEDGERQPCEIWTRVMGYHRPLSSFNIGKQGEYYERRFFRENRIGLGHPAA